MIIGVTFGGGFFSAAYAGPLLPLITLAGNVVITGDSDLQGNVDVGGTLTPADYADRTIQLDDLTPDLQSLIPSEIPFCPFSSQLGFVYEGIVDLVIDFNNDIPFSVTEGDPIKGVYCYAANTPDNQLISDKVGKYKLQFATYSIGNNNFDCVIGGPSFLEIANDNVDDFYIIHCAIIGGEVKVTLIDNDRTVFSDDSLPPTVPPISEFETNLYQAGPFGSAFLDGHITTLIQVQ